jgi:hypothetical protein
MTKSRIRWAGHVAYMGEKIAYRLLVGKTEAKRPIGRLDAGGMITDGVAWTGFIWLRIGTSGGLL